MYYMHSFSIFVQHMLFPNWIMFECLNPAINHFAVHQSVPKVELLFCAACTRVRSWSTSRTTSCASPATSSRGAEVRGFPARHGGTPIAGLFHGTCRLEMMIWGYPYGHGNLQHRFLWYRDRGLEKEADVAMAEAQHICQAKWCFPRHVICNWWGTALGDVDIVSYLLAFSNLSLLICKFGGSNWLPYFGGANHCQPQNKVHSVNILSFHWFSGCHQIDQIGRFKAYGGFLKKGYPQSSSIKHYKPSVLGIPYLWKSPYGLLGWCSSHCLYPPNVGHVCFFGEWHLAWVVKLERHDHAVNCHDCSL